MAGELLSACFVFPLYTTYTICSHCFYYTMIAPVLSRLSAGIFSEERISAQCQSQLMHNGDDDASACHRRAAKRRTQVARAATGRLIGQRAPPQQSGPASLLGCIGHCAIALEMLFQWIQRNIPTTIVREQFRCCCCCYGVFVPDAPLCIFDIR